MDVARRPLPPQAGRGLFPPHALLSLIAFAGCGFRPLYGGGTGSGPGTLLGSVKVKAGRGELPFRLRESLIENLRPARADAPLLLTVAAQLTRRGLLIESNDEITRYNLTLNVAYTLTRSGAAPTAPPLHKGKARTIAAFNATASQYATLVSEREVQARAAEDVADKIVRRIAAAYEPEWLA